MEIFAEGKVAVVTGASSGIGRAVARHCTGLGMKVCIIDIDGPELTQAAEELKQLARNPDDVLAQEADVAKRESMEAVRSAVLAHFQVNTVHFLMNNAGVGTGGGALADAKIWEKTMSVNLNGVINGCQVFVPLMKDAGECGVIVNTGSKQGITCPPGNLAYNVSKAGVKVYTEGLEHELRQRGGGEAGPRRLRAHLLVPGWVNTSIVRKQRRAEQGAAYREEEVPFHEGRPAAGAWMPDQLVAFFMDELRKGTFYIICPDNEVDIETDNLRMQWAMQDITERRPPLSRWHDDYKEDFTAYLQQAAAGNSKTNNQEKQQEEDKKETCANNQQPAEKKRRMGEEQNQEKL